MRTKNNAIENNVHDLPVLESTSEKDDKNEKQHKKVECNICGAEFQQINRFDRFCVTCKEESDIYIYSDGY